MFKKIKNVLIARKIWVQHASIPRRAFRRRKKFWLIFSSMEAKNTFRGCPKVKFGNLKVPLPKQFFISHIPEDISQGLSKENLYFLHALLV